MRRAGDADHCASPHRAAGLFSRHRRNRRHLDPVMGAGGPRAQPEHRCAVGRCRGKPRAPASRRVSYVQSFLPENVNGKRLLECSRLKQVVADVNRHQHYLGRVFYPYQMSGSQLNVYHRPL